MTDLEREQFEEKDLKIKLLEMELTIKDLKIQSLEIERNHIRNVLQIRTKQLEEFAQCVKN